ncbi:hypothetical protein FA09DRAFT_342961 [Tilletiopsis washingtonensis]|uniref:EB1 C-terminal domain-containing protein n=1 Tax=Tilletiopsis washingtonensis TaxID=58919 RepID=A0A316ZC03_9BASI|nr:hypothetical protein FA09DRAFT_342961 [Tilletiopsis washingtonensis]PWN99230.1 hypothetical protein FA09DRAFT_342961 [Tilletiopsis washingtonensis]
MGESRTELIQWLNELLQIQYTKVEQCGSGAAYTQVIDSIYGNVPLGKVNFAARAEYEYLANYKVLQEAFKRNKIDKPIPVERLVRCKMQDNLEFLQWLKKYWDTHSPGEVYDAEARRGGAAAAPPPLLGAVSVGVARTSAAAPRAAARAPVRAAAPAAARAPVRAPVRAAPAAGRQQKGMEEEILNLTGQMDEMKLSVDSLEKERDFYFAKLRDIEVLVQQRFEVLEGGGEEAALELDTLKQIQAVLYSTEEGFEVPEGGEAALLGDEEETF